MRTRVALVSNDHVGSSMAGPGIRYANLARELAREFDVTLVAPFETDLEVEGVTLVTGGAALRPRTLVGLLRPFDAVVAQHLPPAAMVALAGARTRAIYDLYDPLLVENLDLLANETSHRAGLLYEAGVVLQEIALAAGDAFVCASDVQRDLWLGALATLRRLRLDAYRSDRDLRTLVDVVPFGLPAEPLRHERRVLKGVHPGIAAGDRVLLWGGGIWDWLDPLTPIRAVAELARRRPDVKLFFLGTTPPQPTSPAMTMPDAAIALARDLGVLDRHVFFNRGWIPYAERQNYLAEADAGISAHLDTAESRFAFRTRVLDYFWAGLPVVATRGDALAALVEARGLGRTVAYGDVAGWVEAIEAALTDDGTIRRRAAAVREEFAWSRVAEPLARLVELPARWPPRRAHARRLAARHVWLRARISHESRGVVGTARHALGRRALSGR